LFERLLQHVHEGVELERLLDEVEGAALCRFHGVLHGAISRDDDCDDTRIALARDLDDPGAVDPGEAKVGDEDVEGELVEQLDGALAAVCLDDLESAFAEPFGHQSAQRGLIVHEEQVRRGADGGMQGANILTQRGLTLGREQPILVFVTRRILQWNDRLSPS
jgi:hypothetical protein